MLRIIDKITDQLLKLLPSDSDSFTLEDLRKAGFPLFLVEKIHLDLLRNLAESITLPETEWANMNSERVHAAWQAFLATIEAEVSLPDAYKRSVIEGSVEDVVEQLITPREKLLDLVFGTSDSTDIDTVHEHSREFVVYPYLGRALTRYMERKNQKSIDKDKAAVILSKVDERVTGHYTPLNWGQLLEPWFEIMGDQIETDLVRRFFEDKHLDKNAASFESAPDVVNRGHLIEYLTTGPVTSSQVEIGEPVDEQVIEKIVPEAEKEPETEPEQSESEEKVEGKSDQPKEDEVIFTLGKKGSFSKEDKEEIKESEEHAPSEPVESKKSEEKHSKISIPPKDRDTKEKDDLPIWQKFLSAEENEEKEDSSFYNSILNNEKQSEKSKEETTLADTFISKESDEKNGYQPERASLEFSKIREILQDREQSFIEHIFLGNKDDYVEAINKLDSIHEWREASSYLYREVFKHHGVSLYSDEAIEFTDRLQRWYQNKPQS